MSTKESFGVGQPSTVDVIELLLPGAYEICSKYMSQPGIETTFPFLVEVGSEKSPFSN